MTATEELTGSTGRADPSAGVRMTRRGASEPRRITVIGCGHVGLVLAAGLADLGHHVVGVDVSETLVSELCAGVLRIQEPGLTELVTGGVASGRLLFTTSYEFAIPEAEVIFLAVDTPQTLAGAADLRNIRAATRSIAASLNGSNPIIANKSTSPIGTGETIEEILCERPRRAPSPPQDRVEPGVPPPGARGRGLLQPGPDRRRVAFAG